MGRVSQDKGLDFLLEVYNKLLKRRGNLNLLIVGDGPYLQEMKQKAKDSKGIVFLGRKDYEELPNIYAAADLFVFPSATDTFGMAVLEAQSCGLLAVVSDTGGPKEIVKDYRTGLVAQANHLAEWKQRIEFLLEMIEHYPPRYVKMREMARENAVENYDWERALEELTESQHRKSTKKGYEDISFLYAT